MRETMNDGPLENVLCIVRCVTERTRDLCVHLLAREVSPENIEVVCEKPFSQAIRKSFELGIRYDLDWTLCVDADVLIRPGAVAELLAYGEQTDPSIFEVQGMVRDKTLGIRRAAGNHLYRTALLPLALKEIPAEGSTLRPETQMLFNMAKIGYPFIQTSCLVGLHDFEQFHGDLYKKAFLQGAKFKKYFPPIYEYVIEKAREEDDFRVIKKGLEDGFYYSFFDTITVDSDALPSLTPELQLDLGIQEKPPLETGDFEGYEISTLLNCVVTPDTLKTFEQNLMGKIDQPYRYETEPLSWQEVANRVWLELPLPTSLRTWLKPILKRTGRKLSGYLKGKKPE